MFSALLETDEVRDQRRLFIVLKELGGVYLFELRDYARAEAFYRRATEAGPRSEWASVGLFHALVSLGRERDALDEMRRLLSVRESSEYSRLLGEIAAGTREGEDK